MFVCAGMVLVRSDSGQLLMIPQQMLAQMQAQSQAARPTAPTSTTPGQITSAQVIPSDRPKLNWHQQYIFQNDCGIINIFMVFYYYIDFLSYNMGYQMHAVNNRIFFSVWLNSYLP